MSSTYFIHSNLDARTFWQPPISHSFVYWFYWPQITFSRRIERFFFPSLKWMAPNQSTLSNSLNDECVQRFGSIKKQKLWKPTFFTFAPNLRLVVIKYWRHFHWINDSIPMWAGWNQFGKMKTVPIWGQNDFQQKWMYSDCLPMNSQKCDYLLYCAP